MTRLLFFGELRDIAGARARDFASTAPAMTVADLVDAIGGEDADLGAALSRAEIRVMANDEIVTRDAPVGAHDEIAFLPPVSGG